MIVDQQVWVSVSLLVPLPVMAFGTPPPGTSTLPGQGGPVREITVLGGAAAATISLRGETDKPGN